MSNPQCKRNIKNFYKTLALTSKNNYESLIVMMCRTSPQSGTCKYELNSNLNMDFMIEDLIDNELNLDSKCECDEIILESITKLLKLGANPNQIVEVLRNKNRNLSLRITKLLIDHKANLDDPLHQACSYHSRPDIVEILIRSKANLESKNSVHDTPLLNAIKNEAVDCSKITSLLIDSKANVNAIDKYGNNALMHAIRVDHYNSAKLILKSEPDLYQNNTLNQSPLYFCLLQKSSKESINLCDYIASNVNQKERNRSLRSSGVKYTTRQFVKVLMIRGIDKNIVSTTIESQTIMKKLNLEIKDEFKQTCIKFYRLLYRKRCILKPEINPIYRMFFNLESNDIFNMILDQIEY